MIETLVGNKMNVQLRQDIERQIIRSAAIALICEGYEIAVHDGERIAQPRTRKVGEIMQAIQTVDEESLLVYQCENQKLDEWKQVGFVLLVYGNDGWDVLADHSVHLEQILKPAFQHADKLEDMYS
jgi:ribosomal protein L4